MTEGGEIRGHQWSRDLAGVETRMNVLMDSFPGYWQILCSLATHHPLSSRIHLLGGHGREHPVRQAMYGGQYGNLRNNCLSMLVNLPRRQSGTRNHC